MPSGLQGASSLLARVMNRALTVGLDFERGPAAGPTLPAPYSGRPLVRGGVPGASCPLGRCALVYMGECLVAGGSAPKAPSANLGARSSASSATYSLQRVSRWTRARCSPSSSDAGVVRRDSRFTGREATSVASRVRILTAAARRGPGSAAKRRGGTSAPIAPALRVCSRFRSLFVCVCVCARARARMR